MFALPRCSVLFAALTLFPCLTPTADAGLEVKPGTLFAIECIKPNSIGPYTLVQYDDDANILGMLVLNDPIDIGIPSGVAILGGDVFVSGTKNMIAQVDLDTGTLFGGFPTGIAGTEDLETLNGNLLATTWRMDVVNVLDRQGNVLDTITLSPSSYVIGLATDGSLLYTINWNDGDIDVYDMSGTYQHSLPTEIGPQSGSGLTYDPSTNTFWATTGFGTDLILQLEMDGSTRNSWPAGLAFLNGIDRSTDALILNAEPNSVITGDNLDFDIHDGVPGNPVLHAVTSVDGAPFFLPIVFGSFAADQHHGWSTVVPPGLAGLVIGHRAFAVDAGGQVIVSNEELVYHN